MQNPTSYETGKLIDRCWQSGWDIVFHAPISQFPNGYITADRLDNSESRLLIDTVVIPYERVNELIREFMTEKGIEVTE